MEPPKAKHLSSKMVAMVSEIEGMEDMITSLETVEAVYEVLKRSTIALLKQKRDGAKIGDITVGAILYFEWVCEKFIAKEVTDEDFKKEMAQMMYYALREAIREGLGIEEDFDA